MGCLVMFICIAIGSSLMATGCQNAKIADTNGEIHQVHLREVATAPPEIPMWVELRARPLAGSQVSYGGADYVLAVEGESQMAVNVKLAADSKLAGQTEEVVLRGMLSSFPDATKLERAASGEVTITTLALSENEAPPGWLMSYGLMILGFILIGGPTSDRAR